MEYGIGFVVGLLVGFVIMTIDCHRHKVKRRVTLEQERELLRAQVDKAALTIERIISGGE